MFIELHCEKNYSTPAGVEFTNMIIAINIQTLRVWNYSQIITYVPNSISLFAVRIITSKVNESFLTHNIGCISTNIELNF